MKKLRPLFYLLLLVSGIRLVYLYVQVRQEGDRACATYPAGKEPKICELRKQPFGIIRQFFIQADAS